MISDGYYDERLLKQILDKSKISKQEALRVITDVITEHRFRSYRDGFEDGYKSATTERYMYESAN